MSNRNVTTVLGQSIPGYDYEAGDGYGQGFGAAPLSAPQVHPGYGGGSQWMSGPPVASGRQIRLGMYQQRLMGNPAGYTPAMQARLYGNAMSATDPSQRLRAGRMYQGLFGMRDLDLQAAQDWNTRENVLNTARAGDLDASAASRRALGGYYDAQGLALGITAPAQAAADYGRGMAGAADAFRTYTVAPAEAGKLKAEAENMPALSGLSQERTRDAERRANEAEGRYQGLLRMKVPWAPNGAIDGGSGVDASGGWPVNPASPLGSQPNPPAPGAFPADAPVQTAAGQRMWLNPARWFGDRYDPEYRTQELRMLPSGRPAYQTPGGWYDEKGNELDSRLASGLPGYTNMPGAMAAPAPSPQPQMAGGASAMRSTPPPGYSVGDRRFMNGQWYTRTAQGFAPDAQPGGAAQAPTSAPQAPPAQSQTMGQRPAPVSGPAPVPAAVSTRLPFGVPLWLGGNPYGGW